MQLGMIALGRMGANMVRRIIHRGHECVVFNRSSKDPTRVIVDAAVDPHRESQLCRATIGMFVSILASEAGNLALKVLATEGIYVAGGIALRTLNMLREPTFMRAFTNKGRFSDLMKRIPVHVIITNAAGSRHLPGLFEKSNYR